MADFPPASIPGDRLRSSAAGTGRLPDQRSPVVAGDGSEAEFETFSAESAGALFGEIADELSAVVRPVSVSRFRRFKSPRISAACW